jgi:hypothetical protein
MSVRQARVHGRKAWQAHVQLDGRPISRPFRTLAETRGAAGAGLHRQLREALTPEQSAALGRRG